MPDLHPAQFANQMALPGMEHLAHPWARPLSQGYHLQYASDEESHQLQAVDHQWSPLPDAHIEWGNQRAFDPVPGEIHMVMNHVKGTEQGRGLAGALMRSAHHFDFGQDTVPVHSVNRSPEGKAFSDRVMPELKPTVWSNTQNLEMTREGTGEPATASDYRKVEWPGVHDQLHPFQRQQAARERSEIDKAHRDFARIKHPRLF